MAAANCLLLKVKAEGFEVRTRFMFVTITTGNHLGTVIPLGPYEEDHAVVEPTQTLQTLFAIVPGDHALIVVTKRHSRQFWIICPSSKRKFPKK